MVQGWQCQKMPQNVYQNRMKKLGWIKYELIGERRTEESIFFYLSKETGNDYPLIIYHLIG
jgi:hypothetical protein